MTREITSGIEGISADGLPVLHRNDVKYMVQHAQSGTFAPKSIAAFMGQDYHSSVPKNAQTVLRYASATPVLAFSAVAVQTGIDVAGSSQYLGPIVPKVLGDFANNLARIVPGEFTSESREAAHYVPTALSSLLVFSAFMKVQKDGLPWEKRRQQKIKAQATFRKRQQEGTMSWDQSSAGPSVMGYTGDGSMTFDMLRTVDDRSYVEVSFAPRMFGANVALPETAAYPEALTAYKRADIAHTDVLMIMPNSRNNEIFPDRNDPKSYSFGVARAASCIKRIDEVREREYGLGPLPVLIPGDPEQPLNYRHFHDEFDRGTLIHKTLGEHMGELAVRRGAPIEVMSTTQPVIDRTLQLAQHRPITLLTTATGGNMQRRFFSAIGSYQADEALPDVPVVLNDSDRSTEHRPDITPDEDDDVIAIIKEPGRKAGLISSGIDPDKIIVAPQVIVEAILPRLAALSAGV